MRFGGLLHLPILSLLTAGCSSAFQVHQRSDPSALAKIERMSVVVDYSQVQVDPEQKPEIEGAVGAWFVHTLAKSLPDIAIVDASELVDAELVVSVLAMRRGEATPISADDSPEVPSYLEARVTWFVKGEPTDEIQMAIEVGKDGSGTRWDGTKRILMISGGVTSQARLRAASAEIAQSAAEYFTAARGS